MQLEILPKKFRNLKQSRWVHIDLGLTKDSAGVACGHVERFVKVQRGENEYEIMPEIIFDFVLEVRSPKNGEIVFEKVRTLLYKLRGLKLPIKWISMDSYQSKDVGQILRQKNFKTGQVSIDKSTVPYDFTKSAFLDRRILLPNHQRALDEIVHLERNQKSMKIDHPPSGSKDLSDAIAGVVYGLVCRREIWARHKVTSFVPSHVIAEIISHNSE